jgi:putative restriction endonuclease
MSDDWLRSIVPMSGGATSYVETLDSLLEFVGAHHPTTDELLGWHRAFDARLSHDYSLCTYIVCTSV